MAGWSRAPARNRLAESRHAAACIALLLSLVSGGVAAQPALDISGYRGKVVVLDFWASWCAPCLRSIPWLNEMQARYADQGLVVVGVNVDRERADAERFLAGTPSHFAIFYDSEGRLPRQYGVEGMPSSFIFDRDGHLVAKHVGFQSARREQYEQELRELLSREWDEARAGQPAATEQAK